MIAAIQGRRRSGGCIPVAEEERGGQGKRVANATSEGAATAREKTAPEVSKKIGRTPLPLRSGGVRTAAAGTRNGGFAHVLLAHEENGLFIKTQHCPARRAPWVLHPYRRRQPRPGDSQQPGGGPGTTWTGPYLPVCAALGGRHRAELSRGP